MRPRLLALVCALLSPLVAQITPPAQDAVATLGSAPWRAPAHALLVPGASLTYEIWVRPTATTAYGFIMGRGLPTSGADPFVSSALMMNGDGTRVIFAYSTGVPGTYAELPAPTALPLNQWTHLAAVIDGTTTRLLVNGSVVATGTIAGAPAADASVTLGLGAAFLANGATNYPAFAGFARQARVWSVARTAAQITAALGESLPANRAGLVAAWPLDEGTGGSARDLSGNGLTLTGGGAWLRTTLIDLGPFFEVVSSPLPAGLNTDDAILIDFDHDGDPDLITTHILYPPTVPETRLRLRAWRNTGGTFTEATDAVLGNITMVHPRHHAVADFTGDGLADVVIIGHGTDTPPFPGEQAKFLRGTADGRLVDETATRLPARIDFTHNLAVGDIDRDGDLDLYLANVYGGTNGPAFYLNDGTGNFTVATARLPADVADRSNGSVYTAALLVDLTGDGFPELLLGGENGSANRVLRNDGTGRFRDDATLTLPGKLFGNTAVTVAIATADFNADGAPDLLLSTTGGSITLADGRTINGYQVPGLQLLLNRGDGTLYDATARLNLTFAATDTWIEWTRLADLNGDGRTDIVLQGAPNSTGGPFSRTILLNRGAATFVDASEAYRGGAVTALFPTDVDRDGRIDLLGVGNAIEFSRGVTPLNPAPFLTTPADPGRLVNLAVRTRAGSGDQTLIAGFGLSGAGNASLLVRAVGPTLADYDVSPALGDPSLALRAAGSDAIIASNDNWGGTAEIAAAGSAAGAFRLPNTTSKDAALVFTPAAGTYTAAVSDLTGGTGIALVEVYALPGASTPRLINLSARTAVGTGADVLIAGFSVSGNVPKKLLIRAGGPTLAAYGVGSTLADPKLEITALTPGMPNLSVATNDNWGGTAALNAAFSAAGAFPFASATSGDAAIVIELPPGGYTATVSGVNNGTGVALVEVYELP